MTRNLAIKYGRKLAVGASLAVLAVGAFAQAATPTIDTATATAGISAMSTAVLAVIAAMTAAMVAIWGARKVLRMFGR